jgi:hypothetical protein
MRGPRNCFYAANPELLRYEHDIYLFYASTHRDHALFNRKTAEAVAEIRAARASGKKKIVFFNSSESFTEGTIFKTQRIAELLSEIPREDLFYSVGASDGQKFYDDLCEKYGLVNRLNIISANHFEYTIKRFATQIDTPEYIIQPKEKLFVCFNKLHRKHRVQLLAEAIRNKWLEKSYYSFEGAKEYWYLDRHRLAISNKDYETILSMKDRYPLRLNITPQRENPVDLINEDIMYHENSYFSIVTETIMGPYDPTDGLLDYMNTLFLSEKIYKPFAFKHPFITFAWPGTLAALRKRGYKTFHPYIDESYDEEPDYDKRFKMLVNEIKRLEKFTTEEWLKWQENIKPIVEHNYKYLLELDNHRDGPPIDKLFSDTKESI